MMLHTNLIGRQFRTEFGKAKYTIVAVYVNGGVLWMVGECNGECNGADNSYQHADNTPKGRLIGRRVGEVTLIESPRGAA
jgi:hypothetical protein